VPSETEGGLTDVLLVLGGQGLACAVVVVIDAAVEVVDEVMLERTLQTAWHVVVHIGEAEGHTYGLVAAVHGTGLGLGLRVAEADDGSHKRCLGRHVPGHPSQAVLSQGALFRIT